MKKGTKKKGFTLIELIIVIAILGIIAAIAVPKFGSVQKNAKIKADASSAKIIADAVTVLMADGQITIPASDPKYIDVDGNGATDSEQKKIEDSLQKVPKVQAVPSTSNFKFIVGVTKDGTVTVYAGTTGSDAVGASNTLFPEIGSGYPNAE